MVDLESSCLEVEVGPKQTEELLTSKNSGRRMLENEITESRRESVDDKM